jgi:hypothetical protein
VLVEQVLLLAQGMLAITVTTLFLKILVHLVEVVVDHILLLAKQVVLVVLTQLA